MTLGTVAAALDYYFEPDHAWMFGADIRRAVTEFSGGAAAPDTAEAFGFFSEWFLFDFVFRDGMTPLWYFYDRNPLDLPPEKLNTYDGMAKSNRFDFFEVGVVEKDWGMKLMSVRDGATFDIHEKKATRDLQQGDVIACRIASVNGNWDIMGGAAFVIPKPSKRDKKRMRDDFPEFNVKIAYHELLIPSRTELLLSAHRFGNNEALITGGEEDDDCPVCRLTREAKQEGRQLTKAELLRAMEKANKERRRKQ